MRTDLPTGTVTFVFTDVEGSTRLLQELGAEQYADALAEHRSVLRAAFARHGGVEVDSQGDGLFFAFPTAPGALEAAREAQTRLSLPVRMGVHAGAPLLTEEGYVGADVHRAARIAGAGHGRQVLVSASAAALAADGGLLDLGEHRLKDLSAPERIFQIGDAEFAPLRTLYRTNVPIPATAFLGRQLELARALGLLARDEVRLLTLTGPGGTGKTRLALQAAGEAAEAYPDGTWWVPLASLADAAQVIPTIERAVGGEGTLPERVGDRCLLLLLDSFEHVVGAAPELASMLESCPNADVLVTSRERLRVRGEHVYPVPVLERGEARELFIARAGAAQPDFVPDENVDELCSRLDDLPLALELAAARTSLLTPAQLLERLRSRLDLLRGGRDDEGRQATLRATIEWSHELLHERERRLFASLAVFAGGSTVDAAERVAGAHLDVLQSLVDKSLLRQTEERLGMLETIREYALEKLADAGEIRDLLARHANYYAALAERHDSAAVASKRAAVLEELEPEIDNFRAAFRWAEVYDRPLALRLAIVAGWFRVPVPEWHQLCGQAIQALDEVDVSIRIRFLLRATFAAKEVRELDRAVWLYEQLLTAARVAGDARAERLAHGGLGDVAFIRGDLSRARTLYEAALEQAEDAEDRVGLLQGLGETAMAEGDLDQARDLLESALELARAEDLQRLEAKVLHSVGDLALRSGDIEGAHAAYASSAFAGKRFRDPKAAVYCLAGFAAVAAAEGEYDLAWALWHAVRDAADQYPMDDDAQSFYFAQLREVDFKSAQRFASLDEALDAALRAGGDPPT